MTPTNEPAANPPTPGLNVRDLLKRYDTLRELELSGPYRERVKSMQEREVVTAELERLADARPVPPAEVLTRRECPAGHVAWVPTGEAWECLACECEGLRKAIAEHHRQKADDRCIEDDNRLYTAAGLPPCDHRVGDKAAMLANCARFIDRRCEGGAWPTYAELESKLAAAARRVGELEAEVARLTADYPGGDKDSQARAWAKVWQACEAAGMLSVYCPVPSSVNRVVMFIQHLAAEVSAARDQRDECGLAIVDLKRALAAEVALRQAAEAELARVREQLTKEQT